MMFMSDTETKIQALMTAFHKVGGPLLSALSELPDPNGRGTPLTAEEKAAKLGDLIQSTIGISDALAEGLEPADLKPALRWAVAGAATQIVAAGYKATGKNIAAEDAAELLKLLPVLQDKFGTVMSDSGETLPNTIATFRAKSLEALVPVVGAVAQYAFGRPEHTLVAEIADRLFKTADQVTRALAPSGAKAEEWRLLCWSVLKAAGQIYTESHYAEADRLLYMKAEDRAAYFAQHGNVPPMMQVWQSFNQRMAMLATLATYIDIPASARMDQEGWAA
jgi:hypothetical protein